MTITAGPETLILQTDAAGVPVRLEYVRGRAKWEASPASRHQKMVQRIERSVGPTPQHPGNCACFPLADVLIRFADPEHSLKRPDIAIFCNEPPDTDEALDLLPAAVVEVLSLGYEEKDIGPDGAPFYLEQGIRDVLVVDPRANTVAHYQPGQPIAPYPLPHTFDLTCGSRVTVALP